jgi:ribonuclease/clavin/mitogillin
MSDLATAFQEICPGVRCVQVRSPTLPPATHTNVWILGEHHVTVVDPASPYEDEQARLDEILEQVMVERILLTHHHNDHIGGALALKRTTGARIAAHPLTQERLNFTVDELLDENDVVDTDAGFWRVLHTPGHASGHICLFNGGLSTLVAGDMVAGVGTILLDPPDGDLHLYLENLERLAALNPSRLLPAHGPVLEEGTKVLEHYIAHRHMRTEQIQSALAAHPGQNITELTARIYRDLVPDAFLSVAARQVLCHLNWLEKENKIVCSEDTYHLIVK